MQILTEDKWVLFKQDGKLFEKLIKDLLQAEYPEANFEHTTWTRDGGKDFEGGFSLFDSRIKTWAECKYHKTALPIQDVSMTLFMAYIESAQIILFFSYSPVNSEFQKYIDLYQKKSDKTIKIYDDLALEELILRNRNKIDFKYYFDGFFTEETLEVKGITYKYWVHNKTQSRTLHINDLVRLEFCATNHTSQEKLLNVDIKHNKSSKCFEIINSTFKMHDSIKLPPNGIVGGSIDLKLSEYSDRLKYPYVIIEANGVETRLCIPNTVECLWLAETPLLGEENKLFIKKIPTFLNTNSSNFAMLIGSSGTGKSRIINEITSITTRLQYKNILFDADELSHLSAEDFFRELLTQLEDIPDLSHIKSDKIKETCLLEYTHDEYTKFAIHIIFDNISSYKDIKDELVDYLVHMLSKNKICLVMDNIQYYDLDILSVLQMLVEKHKELSSSFILFSANTDYIYEDTLPDKLISQMKLMESKFPHKFVFKSITGFSEKEAFSYLQKCLNGNDNNEKESFSYNQILKKIISVFGTNPLFLQNYLLYLYQERIIKQSDFSFYFIEDITQLQKTFTELPDNLHNLLKIREERFIRDVILEEHIDKYILFVNYLSFLRWMPYNMIVELVEIPPYIIENMEKIGLIKQNDHGEYGFYHQKIEEFYKYEYPYEKMSSNALKKFCYIALHQINRKAYIECIFLAQFILNDIDKDVCEHIISKILANDISYQRTRDICIVLSCVLDNKLYQVLPDKYIDIYQHMTDLLIDRKGIDYAQKLYKVVYDYFTMDPTVFNNCIKKLISMMKSYIINELHLNNPQFALEVSENIITLLKRYYTNNKYYNELLLNVYESQIFIYNEKQDLERALAISDMTIELAEKSSIKQELIKSWFVRGDIYYTNVLSYKFKGEISQCWKKSQELYEENNIKMDGSYSSTALFLNVYMRVVLRNIIDNDFDNTIQYMDSLKKYFSRTGMPFFEIKLRHLLVCYEIFSNSSETALLSQYEKLSFYLKESIDLCAVYGSQTLYLDCFHMLAILQRVCSKYNYAIDNYQKCFSILQRLLENHENIVHWIYIILDITIAMRQLNSKRTIPPHIWQLVSSYPDLKEIIYSICNISEDNLPEYLENMIISSPLYYSEKFIHFPKI